jgi:hypothetical protein
MGIFSFLFGCFDKSNSKKIRQTFSQETETRKTPIQILEYAISDAGLWTWWATDANKSVQLEFDRAMLFIEKESNREQPSHKLALRFISPESVTLLYKKESKLPSDWLELFKKDKLEPFSVDYQHFSFEHNEIYKIFKSADRTETIIGQKYSNNDNKKGLGFWAGEVGIIVVADTMKIVSHSGQIELDEIPELHQKCWDYWEKYWDLRETKTPMPYDPLCEITIPATKENMKKIGENINKK